MYLTMNRFKVRPEATDDFEEVWRTRDRHLKEVPGFRAFHLLKGAESEGHVLYASHAVWEDEASFVAWTKSEAFRAAHKGAKSSGEMYVGPPQLEVFSAVLVED
ncbi:Heme-degrading monooxygenase HmoA [Poseidonocella pacifica]|uniref:Heme-degrading monooxygenase HmoA n=1 Tax=Poseidonocella pacifica TaxID=871651 RepID=A0A1I0WDB1_9RHOB|nr:antibiotic biosynthesis monooxygenase [Poseidonocella pacifica]SFA86745.1 Heme-degrading monooxygenase HmoA [Poseidonocella pacifica]